MVGSLARIPEDIRVALHQEPKLINGILYPDYEEPVKKSGILSRLFGIKIEPLTPVENIYTLPETDSTYIDKTWHGLHFLFTGSDWDGDFPQGFLVSCGQMVGDVDVGYGPARTFTANEVKKLAEYLNGIDKRDLQKRFNPEKMQQLDIYPSIWTECDTDEEWIYLIEAFDELLSFVNETAQRDMALLIYLN